MIGSTAPLIFNLATRRSSQLYAPATLWPGNPQRKMFARHQSWSARCDKEHYLPPSEMELKSLGPVRCLVTTRDELAQLWRKHRHHHFSGLSPSRLFRLTAPGSPLFGFFIFFLVRGGKPISSRYRSSFTLEVAAWITGVGIAGGAANCWGAVWWWYACCCWWWVGGGKYPL